MFGDYIDIYDLTRAVEDGATVPVYFDPRLIKVALRRRDRPRRSSTERPTRSPLGLDDVERAQIQKSVLVVNAVYGRPDRIAELVADLVRTGRPVARRWSR